jgi:hypothetical protein
VHRQVALSGKVPRARASLTALIRRTLDAPARSIPPAASPSGSAATPAPAASLTSRPAVSLCAPRHSCRSG